MARGPDCWPVPRPTPTRPGSWTGWSRSTPRGCGCTSTARAHGGAAATRPPSPPISRRRARRPSGARGDSPNENNARPEPLIREPADHAIGRSRGGLTTKVHALTDGAGRVLVVLLTGGNVHDSPMFTQLMASLRVARAGPGRPRTRPSYLLADKGHRAR